MLSTLYGAFMLHAAAGIATELLSEEEFRSTVWRGMLGAHDEGAFAQHFIYKWSVTNSGVPNGKCEHRTPSLGALACVHHLQIKFPAFRYQASCSGSCRQVISISLFFWSVKWNRTHFVENTKGLVT